MYKIYLPLAGFALIAAFSLPALAQNNPGLEGYEGGSVATVTAFHSGASRPSFDASGTGFGSRLAMNLSLEGYSGEGSINNKARFGSRQDGPQYAARPGFRDYGDFNGYRGMSDDPSTVEGRARAYGR
ncbi:hypothetical protein [Fodinicurvata sediminis]|uniref:hypothetical protein n=1 Tax=Fodinicurvata sediminis TaxID=1121832 RepID=UPI0003B4280E|nr:hypothetical protein [Fodinicurvata sediminis]